MAKNKHVSETPATAFLRQHKVTFSEHLYDYIEYGGANESARQLGVAPFDVVKTLIMEDENGAPLVVLMHGCYEVSLKALARQIGAKRVQPCGLSQAPKYSGYQIGGTSPFGTRKRMPVWVEKTILTLERIYINGGRRGYLVGISPAVLENLLDAKPVAVANDVHHHDG